MSLVRDGEPVVGNRVCTRCGDGDLYPRTCSQCGQRWGDRACGPTHALIAHELGLPQQMTRAAARAVTKIALDAADGGRLREQEILGWLQENFPEHPWQQLANEVYL